MDQIILHITDVNRKIFVNAGRILAYLNRFFIKHMNSMQYCEDLENGFLFIFSDFEAFIQRTQPLDPEVLEEKKIPIWAQVNFFKPFFVSNKKFPPEGADVQVKAISGNPNQALPLIKNFIMSVDPRITIKELDEKTIEFHVPCFEILQKYLNSLINRFYLRE